MRPRVILFNAVSLDGRTTGFDADIGTFYRLASGWHEDVTLVGADTLLAAPKAGETDLRPEDERPDAALPLLAVVDSRGRIDDWATLKRWPYWRAVVALAAEATPAAHLDRLRELGIETIIAGAYHVDLERALEELATRFGAKTVRVDSGGKLNGALLRAGLADELNLLVHPVVVDGEGLVFWGGGEGMCVPRLNLRLMGLEEVAGQLAWLRFEVLPGAA